MTSLSARARRAYGELVEDAAGKQPPAIEDLTSANPGAEVNDAPETEDKDGLDELAAVHLANQRKR